MLIIFDLDGVLIDARPLHFHAFNTAVAAFGHRYVLSWEEHQAHYEGLPTRKKLELLTEHKGFPVERHELAWETKQAISALMVEQVFPDENMRGVLSRLRHDGHQLACVSNSVRATVDRMLRRVDLADLFDYVAGNDEMQKPKPDPECFRTAMRTLQARPERTWIVEDSEPGIQAAHASGAHVIEVDSPDDVTYAHLAPHFWHVLIPMAGAGKRFTSAGYTFPKPLIEVRGRPMIQLVVENIDLPAQYIFLVDAADNDKYQIQSMLHQLVPRCTVIPILRTTDGAARTALCAADLLDERPVLIANSDQWIKLSRTAFIERTYRMEGLIPTFHAVHPKWSFAEVVPTTDQVIRVVEKKPVSTHATCGWYWWRSGRRFGQAAERMIEAGDRTNGEFYIAPVYNYGGFETAEVRIFPVEEMWGLGTPEDLERYVAEGPKR